MTDNQGLSYLKDTIEKQFQSNKQVKADGVHNIIREIKDGYNELGMSYTKDDVLSVLVSVYGFRAEQLAGIKL